MTSTRDKLMGQFRELVTERLGRINQHLMTLESGPSPEALKAALRDLHGLKGEARMMGFADVNVLVHEMEEVVRTSEKGGYALTGGSTDALLAAADAVLVLAGVQSVEGPPPDVAKLMEWLRSRVQAEAARLGIVVEVAKVVSPPPSAPPAPPSAPHDDSQRSVARAVDGKADGSIRISQANLETMTSVVSNLMQRNRRRELYQATRMAMTRELQALYRMAEALGPQAAELSTRLARLKDGSAEGAREAKLLANEELRDLTQLSDEIQAMRMLPLALLLEPYPRMVRELGKELGKDVAIVIDGDDTRVDRSVLEALKDPLMHLVRNAIDHGIETPDERSARGKKPKGVLAIRAQREGERLLLRVEDDGRGLDPQALRASAVKKGLLDAPQAAALSDDAARDLIFVAGFSSKDAVTDISGRGVGLDVVRVKMMSLGGEVTVSSTVGQGVTFELRVPVSLTVAPLLFLEVGGDRLCVGAANVVNALRVESTHLRELAGRPALSVGDQVMPFASISSVLGLAPERAANDGELVLVVRGRGQEAAIAVDKVLEERVQTVLPLKGVLSRYAHLAGATPLADGSLAMVLSAVHLVATAQGKGARLAVSASRSTESRQRRILVVDDSPLTRELISSLLEAVGYKIVNAHDGAHALDVLGKETVDMVVTDLEMPNMDGLELTRRLKGHATLRSLPVVIVTTRGSDADRRRGMEAGADGYVTKGDLVRQDLVDVVSRLLA